ncbi:MAG TPA: toll/interleukin-1 receptor domain-containing protein [Thermoanaerobaculia bacterium]|nr:toll/interleukin-1 receptor domain-containing protein [Thermoanaerobaculia bacterium]
MQSVRTITVDGRVYFRNPAVDRYQIDVSELGDLRMRDIPPSSHVEILGLPAPKGAAEIEVYGLNSGREGDLTNLSVYGGVGFNVTAAEQPRVVERLSRAFRNPDPYGLGVAGTQKISTDITEKGIKVHLFINLEFEKQPEARVREAVGAFVEGLRWLREPVVHAFVCHASDDKETARELATLMRSMGADVWLDEWEIRVGDSIVEKIGEALGKVTHLIVLLSKHSVTRPWVKKEFSAALMRQLSDNSVRVLPVRLDDCEIPPILADIRYADARPGMRSVVTELERSFFGTVGEIARSGGGDQMTNKPAYVRQKLEIAVAMLNGRTGALGKRVRDAWEEMHVLDPEDFIDATARADYEYLQSLRELYVVEPMMPKLTDDQFRDVKMRIARIHDTVVR